jgi:DNA gyrase subunit A
LKDNDKVVAGVVTGDESRTQLLTVSEGGYGKRTGLDMYRLQSRGGKGIINMKVTNKTGKVLGAMMVSNTDEIVLLTSGNKIIRLNVGEIRSTGRATQGVRLVRMDEGVSVAGFDLVRLDEKES